MSWFKSADKIANGVINIARSGMTIWDESKFTPQEQVGAFKSLVEATRSEATSRSRRHLLWALIGFVVVTFGIGIYYNHIGNTVALTGLLDLVDQLKIGWGFTSAVSFYFLTHAFGKLTGK